MSINVELPGSSWVTSWVTSWVISSFLSIALTRNDTEVEGRQNHRLLILNAE
jgi:hypothetical protein